jgi:hypothetical protein
VWGCGARHSAGILRTVRAPGGTPHRVRRFPRRDQGEQHAQGSPPIRSHREGIQEGARSPQVATSTPHCILELQPLPGGRGFQERPGIPERPGYRTQGRFRGGVRRGIHGDRARVRARPRLQAGWSASEHARGSAPQVDRLRDGADLCGTRQPGSRHPGFASTHLHQGLRRRRAGERHAGLAAPTAVGHGYNGSHESSSHVAASAVSAATRDETRVTAGR